MLTGGVITFTDGIILVVFFLVFLAYILYRESENDTPVFRDLYAARTLHCLLGDQLPRVRLRPG